jgi:hypothetical protein
LKYTHSIFDFYSKRKVNNSNKEKMSIIKETKYLTFDAYNIPSRKTKHVSICNKNSGEEIATIDWYGPWRQYCFMPERFEFNTVWNSTCLTDVISVIDMLMKERQKPEKPVNGIDEYLKEGK